jgi:carboxyl-terminal processing protease
MKIARTIVFVIFLLSAACGKFPNALGGPTAKVTPTNEVFPTGTSGISPEAAKYLNDALDIMENNSINKHKIDWPTLRAYILNAAANAKTPTDTYPFIKMALWHLNDRHSFFMNPQDASTEENGTSPTPIPPEIKLVENKFGYVAIPSYMGLNRDLINQYGTDMQKQIQEIDRQNPCGWIVDLRGNQGGNMWPMLIGVGPILGEGKAGSWIDADGNQDEWAYMDGKGMDGTEVVSEVIGEPYHLANPDAPVAVLFGADTASSGEIIVISFIGRMDTRSFGSKSGGYMTANSGFPLKDQAIIFLTTAIDADRTGKMYGEAIIPDVQVNGDNNYTGPIPDEALQWPGDQPACH